MQNETAMTSVHALDAGGGRQGWQCAVIATGHRGSADASSPMLNSRKRFLTSLSCVVEENF